MVGLCTQHTFFEASSLRKPTLDIPIMRRGDLRSIMRCVTRTLDDMCPGRLHILKSMQHEAKRESVRYTLSQQAEGE